LINVLDRDFFYRMPIKIGVVNVKSGQCTQRDILFNSTGSELFNWTLKNIGEVVKLDDHNGYIGNLSKQNGYTLYYQN